LTSEGRDRLSTLDRRVDSFGLIEVLKQQSLGGSLFRLVKVRDSLFGGPRVCHKLI
jgi:hypothetical protein